MRKILTLAAILLAGALSAQTAHAQKAQVSLSPELLVPFGKGWSVGLGGILEGEWAVENNLGLTLAGGVGTVWHKNEWVKNYTFLPLKGGAKYYVDDQFYVNLNLGAAVGFNDYGTNFLFGGGAGYQFTPKMDAHFRIEDAGVSYLALGVAFKL